MSPARTYRYLFNPLKLGGLTLTNRIVFSAHLTNYAGEGMPTEQHAAYYAARAAGGAGLIITEEHSTHPTDHPYEKLIKGFDPRAVAGYRRITKAVHAHGTPILAQLNHNGGQASSMYTRLPVWAPSPVPDPLFREVPKEVEEHEIAAVIDGYARTARHCVEGGFDGVELQCSHSSIVRGFLSPATNLRGDRWGGSPAGRARLLMELIAAVRGAVGPDPVVGVRLCGDELIEGGTTIDEAVETARMVEATGAVDYINTSIGVATATLHMIEASMRVPPGYAMYIPTAIRDAVDLPVIGVGRFKDPLQADRALAAGQADLIGVVRGQIADPDFAAKAREGKAASIRTCLSCNQECVGRMGLNRWLGCIENPRTGHEAAPEPAPGERSAAAQGVVGGPARSSVPPGAEGRSWRRRTVAVAPPRHRPRTLVVVGGGPGGLQAAATAARRGHEVMLFERAARLGGQIATAAAVPSRAELLDLTRNLAAEARAHGADLRTGTPADAALLRERRPDAVVLATGARPEAPWWADGHPRVVDVRAVLEGTAEPAGAVLVVDELGFHQATSVAELLADRGCAVEIVTPAMSVGQDLGITLDLEAFTAKALMKGTVFSSDRVCMGAERLAGGGVLVRLQHHPTGVEEAREVDWAVCAVHQRPEDELWQALRADGPGVHRVGDCLSPRRAHSAVIEGHEAALAL